MTSDLLGIGLYSLPQAEHITGIKKADIARWLFGSKTVTPLWASQVPDISLKAIGFRDLIEIRFVHAFRQYGVSLQSIRAAAHEAKELYKNDYPFTCEKFHTDGKDIFATINPEDDSDKKLLLQLSKRQYVFNEVIAPSLYGIELHNDLATKWYPVKDSKRIVLNPLVSFGKPIIEGYGVPTQTLYQSYQVEHNINFVADIFDVPPRAVEDAVAYEKKLAA